MAGGLTDLADKGNLQRCLRLALRDLDYLNRPCGQTQNRQRNATILCRLSSHRMRERMMTFKILGAAVALAALAGPAVARHAMSSPAYPSQSVYCATREMGNPYSKYCDYIAWSGWRRRGGWDSRLDDACMRNPGFVPSGCWR
jgi:hypothetical protein